MSRATKMAIIKRVLKFRRSFKDCAEIMDDIVYSGSLK